MLDERKSEGNAEILAFFYKIRLNQRAPLIVYIVQTAERSKAKRISFFIGLDF